MSHERESFPTLENDQEQGVVLSARIEGETPVGKNGSIGFAFKDNDGNVVLPKLNPEGAIPVTSDPGTTLRDRGGDDVGHKTVPMELVTLTLQADKLYTKLSAQGSCFKGTEFEIVLIDDAAGTPVESILDIFLTGPGQFTTKSGLEIDVFDTTGFTGVVELKLRALNLVTASKTTGSMSVNEIA